MSIKERESPRCQSKRDKALGANQRERKPSVSNKERESPRCQSKREKALGVHQRPWGVAIVTECDHLNILSTILRCVCIEEPTCDLKLTHKQNRKYGGGRNRVCSLGGRTRRALPAELSYLMPNRQSARVTSNITGCVRQCETVQ